MSIRPTIIDRNGNSPCIPQVALLMAMRRAAEGHAPSLADRVRKALAQLRKRLAR
jgi:hypothetical protein